MSRSDLPADIYPESGSRVPPASPDQLDELGKHLYERITTDSRLLAGLKGPAGVLLHTSRRAQLEFDTNRYLRFEAGLDPHLVEIAILTTAREMEQPFEWHAHEPAARKVGVEPATIEIIRDRRPLDSLADQERALIQLGREAVGEHHVSSATFATARALFELPTLLNYLSVMGTYAATAILLTAVDQQVPSAG